MEEGPFSAEGFERGVASGLERGSDLLHSIFSVRTLPLFDRLPGTMVADYLSGLLIGSEIAAGRRDLAGETSVTIVGRGDLSERYSRAIEKAGLTCRQAPEHVAARGQFEIAVSAGLLQ